MTVPYQYLDRVQDTTTTSGTGTITLSNNAQPSFRLFSAFTTSISNVPYVLVQGSGAEVGIGTMVTATTLSRDTILWSTNSNAAISLSGSVATIFNTLPAAAIQKFCSIADISFSSAILFTIPGVSFMPQQVVSSVIAFTISSGNIKNASTYVRLLSDGTNVPTFTGFKEWGGSLGYNNQAGIVNEISFWYDGYDYWYAISQAIGAVPSVAPTVVSVSVSNAAPTQVVMTMSTTMDSGFVSPTSAHTVSGHTVTAVAVSGTSVTLTVTPAFTFGETARTTAYTQPGGTGNLRDTSGNLLATFSGQAITNNVATVPGAPTSPSATAGNTQATVTFVAPASNGGSAITGYTATSTPGGFTGSISGSSAAPITVTGLTNGTSYTFTVHATNAIGNSVESASSNIVTPASITVPGAPTIGTATGGNAQATVTFTAPGSNGGSAITGYTATSTPGSFTGSITGATAAPITVTGLTNGTAYTFTVHATNAIGNSSESAASNSVTPAGALVLRYGQLSLLTESGSSPNWVYTGDAGAGPATYSAEGILTNTFSTGNCSVTHRCPTRPNEFIWGLTTSSTPVSFAGLAYGIYVNSSNAYAIVTGGTPGTASPGGTFSLGDLMRITRTGTTITFDFSHDSGATWTTFHTYTGVPSTAYHVALCLNQGVVIDQLSGVGLI